MNRIKWVGLLGAAILPGILSAGAITTPPPLQLGTSTSTLTFTPPDLFAGPCVANVCTITGNGSLHGVTEGYTITTTLANADAPITWSGLGPTFALHQNGASILFAFSDQIGDSLGGTIALGSMVASTSPQDATDIFATLTFTSVNLLNTTPGLLLQAFLLQNYGPLPTVNGTAQLDLTVSCNTGTSPNVVQVPCVVDQDPVSTNVTTSITPGGQSAVPEPASIALLGCGLAAIAFKLKRRK